ncbi:AAA domain-containing protein [Arcicella aurantiaca]|uniref:AAA domain-containing protein n=1 Tax=Arcicella aurantiaca TaxID=591202 RepID=A0A316EDQ8_9BACT|nr:AAA family ATPase [Arcicella aurantiaca]PWK28245.1 AAA domain-containing protein [Arcicella aurantiaca]
MEFNPVSKKQPDLETPEKTKEKEGLLVVRTANACIDDAKNQAVPLSLCGNFWFEGEVAILFADTNVGKSIFAVQSANNISDGNSEGMFGSKAPPQKVIYLDFELSDKQFERRYSVEWENHYLFNSNFLRVMINVSFTDFENFEKQLFEEIENILIREQAKVLIVDNITYLRMQSTESGKEALPLMKHLIQLKNKLSLSMMILAHTPKRSNPMNPLTVNDLAGSKQLANFADSIFCIGKSSQGEHLRYVKQVKARSCGVSDNVMVCELDKPYNFLGFTFKKEDKESNHLQTKSEAEEELKEMITALKNDNSELSLREIAKELDINHMKVKRLCEKYNL